jgi:translation initiation factor 2 subunit 2
MEEYQVLLKKAMEKIPRKTSSRERFEIPEVVSEIQGFKTLVKNFGKIAVELRREPSHLSKYLFKELATPGSIQGSVLILQSRFSKDVLQKKINDYVKEFVYCKVCGEPDTKLEKEDRITFMKCEACGARSPVRSI